MTTVLIIFGLLVSIVGLVGCILPIIPGPPLSFLALIVLSFARGWEPFGAVFLVSMAALATVVTVLDFVVPAAGARRYGASKISFWLSMAGMLVGVFFSPLGIFVGAFVGAVAGELLSGKEGQSALKAGWGVFVGTLASIGLKLAASALMLFYYVKEMF